jgi:galacturan 1,4-alpha-galacturonidase
MALTDKYYAEIDLLTVMLTYNQSMGSIGEYSGQMSIIENVLIENIWIMNGANGARLKTWAGPNIGYGSMNNVTFRSVYISCIFIIIGLEIAKTAL